jgi:AraC-like DNA-binding protein
MEPLAHNNILEPLFRFAATLGLAAQTICDAIGLDLDAATKNGGLVPATLLIDAVEWSAQASGYPNFGLLAAERVDSRIIGLPALIAEQCRSIPDYYDLIQHHLGHHTTGYSLTFRREGPEGVGRLYFAARGQFEPRHFAEATLAVHARAFRQFLGASWRPRAVQLVHDPIGKMGDYARAFGAEVLFNAGQNAILFSAEDLRWRAAGAGSTARWQFEQIAADDQHDAVARAAAMIRTLLSDRKFSIAVVAEALHRSPRTLQRQLKEADTSFSKLLIEARIALAQDYLGRERLSANEVAARLGFSEVSALSRFLRQHLNSGARAIRRTNG